MQPRFERPDSFDSFLFRCNSLNQIMVNIGLTENQKARLIELSDRQELAAVGKAKALTANMEIELSELIRKNDNPDLPEGLQKFLNECYIQHHYGRTKKLKNKYITKGLEVEKFSLDLYEMQKNKLGRQLRQNEQRINNAWISGKPDILKEDGTVIDLKSSWDLFTFFDSKEKVNNTYYWQLQGYLALTDRKLAELAYCLIDTPLPLVHDEQRRLMWEMNAMTDNDPDYKLACEEIEFNHMYNDLEPSERIHIHYIKRNDEDIQRIYKRVELCRDWVNKKYYSQQ